MTRHDGRSPTELRPIEILPGYLTNPLGSVLISIGNTRLLCTASIEDKVPIFLASTGLGWITSEYSMIPAATRERTPREATRGRQSGRTMEIQRLIGRAMRSVVDRKALGERTLWVDCEVLQADGGTRTASITGGYIAMAIALAKLREKGTISKPPLKGMVAAISVGILEGAPILDLDYKEDSSADVDMNVVRTDDGRYVELQGTAEATPFGKEALDRLLEQADRGVEQLIALQRQAIGARALELLRKAK
jgi:ribonuclease PH